MKPDKDRLDKWLWHARFFKTRRLSAELVAKGRVRLNGSRVHKPAQAVGPNDVLTFPQSGRVRVVRVIGTALRRGPATEAERLYEDLEPGQVQVSGTAPS
ncbi:MAG: RNA-binding S4 domain-containing protein [Pseudomonadota bacterium]